MFWSPNLLTTDDKWFGFIELVYRIVYHYVQSLHACKKIEDGERDYLIRECALFRLDLNEAFCDTKNNSLTNGHSPATCPLSLLTTVIGEQK